MRNLPTYKGSLIIVAPTRDQPAKFLYAEADRTRGIVAHKTEVEAFIPKALQDVVDEVTEIDLSLSKTIRDPYIPGITPETQPRAARGKVVLVYQDGPEVTGIQQIDLSRIQDADENVKEQWFKNYLTENMRRFGANKIFIDGPPNLSPYVVNYRHDVPEKWLEFRSPVDEWKESWEKVRRLGIMPNSEEEARLVALTGKLIIYYLGKGISRMGEVKQKIRRTFTSASPGPVSSRDFDRVFNLGYMFTRNLAFQELERIRDESLNTAVGRFVALARAMDPGSAPRDFYRAGQLDITATHMELLAYAKAHLPAKEFGLLQSIANKIVASSSPHDVAFRRLVRALNQMTEKYEIASMRREIKILGRSHPHLHPDVAPLWNHLLDTYALVEHSPKTVARALRTAIGLLDEDFKGTQEKRMLRAMSVIKNAQKTKIRSMNREDLQALLDAMNLIQAYSDRKDKIRVLGLHYQRAALENKVVSDIGDWFSAARGDMTATEPFVGGLSRTQMSIETLLTVFADPDTAIHGLMVHELSDRIDEFISTLEGGRVLLDRVLEENGLDFGQLAEMSDVLSGWVPASPLQRAIYKRVGLGLPKPAIRHQITLPTGRKLSLTAGERMSFAATWKRQKARLSLIGRDAEGIAFAGDPHNPVKITPEIAKAIIDTLTPTEIVIVEAITRVMNTYTRDKINAWSVRELGYNKAEEKDFFPVRRVGDKSYDAEVYVGTTYAENLSILQEYKGGNAPMMIYDIFGVYYSHLSKVAMVSAYATWAREAMGLLRDGGPVARAMDRSPHYRAVRRDITDRIKGVVTIKYNPKGVVDQLVETLVRKLTVSTLAANVPVIASQSLSMFNILMDVDWVHVKRGFDYMWTHKFSEVEQEVEQYAPQLANMVRGGGVRIINPDTAAVSIRQFYGYMPMTDRSMYLLSHENERAIVGIWEAIRSEGEAKGYEGTALLQYMGKRATYVYNHSQPNQNVAFQAGLRIAAKDSSLARVVAMYTGQTSMFLQQLIQSQLLFNHGKISREDHTRNVLMSTIIQATLFNLLKWIWWGLKAAAGTVLGIETYKWAEDQDWADWVARILGDSLGIGVGIGRPTERIITTLKDRIRGQARNFDILTQGLLGSVQPAEVVNDALMGIFDAIASVVVDAPRGEYKGDTLEHVVKAVESIAAMLGVPLKTIGDITYKPFMDFITTKPSVGPIRSRRGGSNVLGK